jgi:signal transduction histidine kinase
MERSAKPAKVKVEAKPSVTRIRKSRKVDDTTVRQLEARLVEALEQQAATSDILRVIGSAPTDLQPVLDAIVASAATLCDSVDAQIFRVDGDVLRPAASYGSLPQITGGETRPVNRGSVNGRAVVDRRTIHVHDLAAESESEYPEAKAFQRRFGHRTTLATPLLREKVPLGVITIRRMEVRPFSDDQIKRLETFADQAVIAIENARLFNETKQALEQQTATSEILRVISNSPTDTQPVFDTIVQSGLTLFPGALVSVALRDGDTINAAAVAAPDPARAEAWRRTISRTPLARNYMHGAALLDRRIVDISDVADAPAEFVAGGQNFLTSGNRAITIMPMMRGDEAIGLLSVVRLVPGPLSDKQIALLKSFAAQAVIAIENVRLFREIEDKSHQLETASRHKSEFLANMSHELRTPLNAIIGFSEVLAEKMFGEINDKQAEYLADILESGRHLLSLINDILDLSKIEAGRMELEPADFDLPGAIDNALTLVRERAHRHGITLLRNVDERLGMICADERKVKQVLLNLLSNALKFTPAGGRIDVQAIVRDGDVEISVTDTGVGIAPEDQVAVFEEFRQVGATAKKIEGTGLGLAISRKFIELHRGKIWAKSEMGAGATFTFTLPLTHDQHHHAG